MRNRAALSNHDLSRQVKRILQGDVRTIARTLTQIENGEGGEITPVLKALFAHTGKSFVIGVTGSPGAGKSTLVDQLALRYRKLGQKVGIVAVDPTSPFTGGAILADRIRMQSLSTDPNVFVRSMATRGKMGGLSPSINEALMVLDAAGYPILIVETVGAGQDEVDIAKTAHATVVLVVPGMGDAIQTLKAGMMEIADLFVINKADREGASTTEQELAALLSISSPGGGWVPPMVKTVATRGEGVDELLEAIERYRSFLSHPGRKREQGIRLFREHLLRMLGEQLQRLVFDRISEKELDQYAEKLMTRELDPYTIMDRLLERTDWGGRK